MALFGKKDDREPRPSPEEFAATTRQYEDFDVAYSEFLCGARVNMSSARIDVIVHHPLFALLSADARMQAARDALVAALGERDTADWIGVVTVSLDPPIDPLAIPLLGHVVDQLIPLRRRRPR